MLTLILILFVCIFGLIPFVLPLLSISVKFWTRERHDPEFFTALSRKVFKNRCKSEAQGCMASLSFIIAGVFVILAHASDRHGFVPVLITGLVVILYILPRYVLDVCNSFKYSFKTRDSERISKLERQLKELKNRR